MKAVSAEAPRVVLPVPAKRRGKLVSRPILRKSLLAGAGAVTPSCPRCDNQLVWRGKWRCDACPCDITWQEYSDPAPNPEWSDELNDIARRRARAHGARVAQPPSELPAQALAGTPLFSSSEGDNCPDGAIITKKADARIAWTEWLEAIELYTSMHRLKRAAMHRAKAAMSPAGIESQWHMSRATGQAERFNRIASCGEVRWMLVKHCDGGTVETPIESRCDCWRLCGKCLERRRFRLKTGIEKQRELAFRVHAHRMRPGYGRGKEGKWGEKLITLTVPHGNTPAEDAQLLSRAWRKLGKRIASHLRVDRGMAKGVKPVWVRALEVEPGATGGHAHLHVWWLGPFLDATWLHVEWGRILEAEGRAVPHVPWEEAMGKAVDARARVWCRTRRGPQGREASTVPWPVVSLNAGHSGGAGKYATKVGVGLHRYVAKGAKSEMQRLEPIHAASLYVALEGSRAVQWAAGWAPKRDVAEGVVYSRRRLSEEEVAAVSAPHAADDAELLAALDAAHDSIADDGAGQFECSHAPPRRRWVQLGLLV